MMNNATFTEREIHRMRQAVECQFERLTNHGKYSYTGFYAEFDPDSV